MFDGPTSDGSRPGLGGGDSGPVGRVRLPGPAGSHDLRDGLAAGHPGGRRRAPSGWWWSTKPGPSCGTCPRPAGSSPLSSCPDRLGVANLAVVHRLSDLRAAGAEGSAEQRLAEGLLADSETRVVFGQAPSEAEVTRRPARPHRDRKGADQPAATGRGPVEGGRAFLPGGARGRARPKRRWSTPTPPCATGVASDPRPAAAGGAGGGPEAMFMMGAGALSLWAGVGVGGRSARRLDRPGGGRGPVVIDRFGPGPPAPPLEQPTGGLAGPGPSPSSRVRPCSTAALWRCSLRSPSFRSGHLATAAIGRSGPAVRRPGAGARWACERGPSGHRAAPGAVRPPGRRPRRPGDTGTGSAAGGHRGSPFGPGGRADPIGQDHRPGRAGHARMARARHRHLGQRRSGGRHPAPGESRQGPCWVFDPTATSGSAAAGRVVAAGGLRGLVRGPARGRVAGRRHAGARPAWPTPPSGTRPRPSSWPRCSWRRSAATLAWPSVVRWTNTGDFDEPVRLLELSGEGDAAMALAACAGRDERILSSVAPPSRPFWPRSRTRWWRASTAASDVDLRPAPGLGRAASTCAGPATSSTGSRASSPRWCRPPSPRPSAGSTDDGRPLDPPLLLVLDEAANIAPVRDLDTLASTGAGMGVQLVTICQDLAQLAARYGPERSRTIANNHRAKLLLSGVSDLSTLDLMSGLAGEQAVREETVTHDLRDGRRTTSTGHRLPAAGPDRRAPADSARPRGSGLRPPAPGPSPAPTLVPRTGSLVKRAAPETGSRALAGPAGGHPGRFARHLRVHGRPRGVEQPGVEVAPDHLQ